MSRYGSVRELADARPEDLATMPGITLETAKRLVEVARSKAIPQ